MQSLKKILTRTEERVIRLRYGIEADAHTADEVCDLVAISKPVYFEKISNALKKLLKADIDLEQYRTDDMWELNNDDSGFS